MENNQKEISEKFKDLGKEVPAAKMHKEVTERRDNTWRKQFCSHLPQDTNVWRQIFDSKNKPIGPANQ